MRNLISAILLVLVLGVVYAFSFRSMPVKESVGPSSGSVPVTTVPLDGSTTTIPIEGGTITIVESPKEASPVKLPAPSLLRPVVFKNNESQKVQDAINSNITELTRRLKQNPSSFQDWNNLALLRSNIGDNDGARDIWIYLGKMSPLNSVSFLNLGFLYGYTYKDTVLSEKNYLVAIQNDPKAMQGYVQLFEMYRDVEKNRAKAEVLLQKMREIFPEQVEEIERLRSTLS